MSEKEEGREVLCFASYCGDENPNCTDKKPCPICLGMSNVYRVYPDGRLEYVRELAPEWNIDPPSWRKPSSAKRLTKP